MFTFLNPYLLYLKLGVAVIVIGVCCYFVWEYKSMQASLVEQTHQIEQLNEQVVADQTIIVQKDKDMAKITLLRNAFDLQTKATQQQFEAVVTKLQQLNIPAAIKADPMKAETDINSVFNNITQCLAQATGATATCAPN